MWLRTGHNPADRNLFRIHTGKKNFRVDALQQKLHNIFFVLVMEKKSFPIFKLVKESLLELRYYRKIKIITRLIKSKNNKAKRKI